MHTKQCDAEAYERQKARQKMTKRKRREINGEAHSPGMEYCSLAVMEKEGESNDISKVQLKMDALDPGKGRCWILNSICHFILFSLLFLTHQTVILQQDYLIQKKSLLLSPSKQLYVVFCTNTVVKKLMTSKAN